MIPLQLRRYTTLTPDARIPLHANSLGLVSARTAPTTTCRTDM